MWTGETLGDWQLTFAIGVFLAAVVIAISIVIILLKVKAEVARLREAVMRLSEDVKHLLNAEQRRFLQELKLSKRERGGDDVTMAD
jgi:hypothetical protein